MWAVGVAAGSQWITILPLPLAITLRYSIVARKEGFLDLRFGDAYDDQGVCPPSAYSR